MHDIWNPWHGCVKCSKGCQNCYMYFLDRMRDKNGTDIFKTSEDELKAQIKNQKGRQNMKSAVIYYSRSGITKGIAKKINAAFDSDMYFVEPEKAYGGYLSAVLRNGFEKLRKKVAKVSTHTVDFSDYDVIFVGFPVWYGTMPDFMQEYIKRGLRPPCCRSK